MTDAITYLEEKHRLRRNVLTGELLYADAAQSKQGEQWHRLSKEGRNTLILEAEREGVPLTDETLNRFVHSTLIDPWNPAREWLESLPEWDGEDHVFDLSQRIVTSNPDWGDRFHKWLLQTVARWMDMEVPHRDIIVPVLVGQWGYGKTSFCNLILPPTLRLYYTDKIKLSSSADVYELLTTNLLVNLDEFYQENTLQEPLVRYLFSRSTPVFRRAYGTTEEPRRQYAGFIATTGNLHPMTDAAGAAHLACVEVGHKIDLSPIPYEQLYAQLREELEDGADYLLTDDERERMAGQNSPFEEADNLVKMVRLLYANPPKGQKAKAVYIDTIIDRLMQEYPYWTPGEHVNQDVGFALQEAGFTRSRIHGRSCYRIVPRDPRRLDFTEDAQEEKKQDDMADNPLAQALLAGLGVRPTQALPKGRDVDY
ncbi:MAG: VapE domain-containing protein [Prevotella sp.]